MDKVKQGISTSRLKEGQISPMLRWLTGDLIPFLQNPLAASIAANHWRPVARLRFLHMGVALILDPALTHQVFMDSEDAFNKGKPVKAALDKWIGDGLLVADGEYWKHQRKLIAPLFHHRYMTDYVIVMHRRCLRLVEGWNDGQHFDLKNTLSKLTLGIVCEALFSEYNSDRYADELAEILKVLVRVVGLEASVLVLPDWLPIPYKRAKRQAAARLRDIVEAIIADRRSKQDSQDTRPDLLSLMLAARDEQDQAMSDTVLRNESATLLLAGHETTATTLMWAFVLLAQRPELYAALALEARQVLGDSVTAPTLDQLAQLKLATAVIAETLRLYPAAWLTGREANHRVHLTDDVVIPKGGLVFISAYNNHRNPAYFSDPEAFLPERWLDGSLEKNLPKGVYIPFGEGPVPRLSVHATVQAAQG